MKNNATPGKITGLPATTPNLILHSAWWGPVVWINCESTGYINGHGGYVCDAGQLNGPDADHRWWVNSAARPAWNDLTGIVGTCTIDDWYTVRVDVTRNGNHDTKSFSFRCTAIAN
jgi:hypothetical protein